MSHIIFNHAGVTRIFIKSFVDGIDLCYAAFIKDLINQGRGVLSNDDFTKDKLFK